MQIETTEKIWYNYRDKLSAFINKRVNDPAAAEDLLQDVFLKIHTGLKSEQEIKQLGNWLYQITRNTIIDYYRTRKSGQKLSETDLVSETDPDERARRDIAEGLVPMIKCLPEHYRTPLLLSEIEGKTQSLVAQEQGLSLSGAKSRIQRGRVLLKNMLLDCCEFEFDNRGRVIDYKPKSSSCKNCDQ